MKKSHILAKARASDTLEKTRSLAKAGAALNTAAARRAEELLTLIARRKENIVDAFYDIGEALKELLDKKLHMALGHTSFGDLITTRGVMGRTQAFKLIAVVKALPRATAISMGQERAYALVALAAATPEADTAASLLSKRVTVHGAVRDVSHLSRRELTELAREVRPRKKKSEAALEAAREATRIAKIFKKQDRAAKVEIASRKGHFVATVHVRLDVLVALLRRR